MCDLCKGPWVWECFVCLEGLVDVVVCICGRELLISHLGLTCCWLWSDKWRWQCVRVGPACRSLNVLVFLSQELHMIFSAFRSTSQYLSAILGKNLCFLKFYFYFVFEKYITICIRGEWFPKGSQNWWCRVLGPHRIALYLCVSSELAKISCSSRVLACWPVTCHPDPWCSASAPAPCQCCSRSSKRRHSNSYGFRLYTH